MCSTSRPSFGIGTSPGVTTLTAGDVVALLEARMAPSARRWMEPRVVDGLPLLVADEPRPFGAAFTTRCGADRGGDGNADPFDLARGRAGNRDRLMPALHELAAREGAARLTLVSPRQEHGVRVVGAAEYRRGSADAPCDGLTIHPVLDRGLAALLLFADCVPVVLAGEVDTALVHAGWRGMLGGVVQQGARAMIAPPGSAVIGPSIGPCCFTVGEEVAQAFARRYGDRTVLPGPRVDLWEAAESALGEVGVPRSHIRNPRLCTVCNADLFFSYRADGPATGRHGAVVWSKES